MQRVKANLQKLIANKVISEEQGVADLLSMDFETLPYGKQYANKIRQLTSHPDELGRPPGDCFEITEGGALKCDAQWKYDVLREFVREPAKYSEALFAPW